MACFWTNLKGVTENCEGGGGGNQDVDGFASFYSMPIQVGDIVWHEGMNQYIAPSEQWNYGAHAEFPMFDSGDYIYEVRGNSHVFDNSDAILSGSNVSTNGAITSPVWGFNPRIADIRAHIYPSNYYHSSVSGEYAYQRTDLGWAPARVGYLGKKAQGSASATNSVDELRIGNYTPDYEVYSGSPTGGSQSFNTGNVVPEFESTGVHAFPFPPPTGENLGRETMIGVQVASGVPITGEPFIDGESNVEFNMDVSVFLAPVLHVDAYIEDIEYFTFDEVSAAGADGYTTAPPEGTGSARSFALAIHENADRGDNTGSGEAPVFNGYQIAIANNDVWSRRCFRVAASNADVNGIYVGTIRRASDPLVDVAKIIIRLESGGG